MIMATMSYAELEVFSREELPTHLNNYANHYKTICALLDGTISGPLYRPWLQYAEFVPPSDFEMALGDLFLLHRVGEETHVAS